MGKTCRHRTDRRQALALPKLVRKPRIPDHGRGCLGDGHELRDLGRRIRLDRSIVTDREESEHEIARHEGKEYVGAHGPKRIEEIAIRGLVLGHFARAADALGEDGRSILVDRLPQRGVVDCAHACGGLRPAVTVQA